MPSEDSSLDLDGYTFQVFVPNRQDDEAKLRRDYSQRVCCEQHSKELIKNDLQADGFCMTDSYAIREGIPERVLPPTGCSAVTNPSVPRSSAALVD